VVGAKLVKNELYRTDAGTMRPRPTEELEEIPAGIVFRSIGYRGVAMPGVPFNDSWGVINNEKGRVFDPKLNRPIVGLYTAGWIKRGPSGVIGTNKPDAVETVEMMLADLAEGRVVQPPKASVDAARQLISSRQPAYFSYADWQILDQAEIENGRIGGRPRVKFTSVSEMEKACGKG